MCVFTPAQARSPSHSHPLCSPISAVSALCISCSDMLLSLHNTTPSVRHTSVVSLVPCSDRTQQQLHRFASPHASPLGPRVLPSRKHPRSGAVKQILCSRSVFPLASLFEPPSHSPLHLTPLYRCTVRTRDTATHTHIRHTPLPFVIVVAD